jgi:type I restriction enzyme M protein
MGLAKYKKFQKNKYLKIINKIKISDKFIENIDQYLHNKGINKLSRLNVIKYVIYNLSNNQLEYENTSIEILKYIQNIINSLLLDKSEIIQRLFMFYGNIIMKNSLDQFYTPLTISEYFKNVMLPNKKYIDPASGTGDLLIKLEGDITLWDISKEACALSKLNYELFNKKVSIKDHNSLLNYNLNNNSYDYCSMNPPFGTKTVTTDKNILSNYELSNNKDKQELGILFIERAIKLLKENGILFIIVPGGYLGNNSNMFLRNYIIHNTKILSIVELPSNTFARSGAGVSTYLLTIQKQKVSNLDYMIHICKINEIGYELNKKNTPIKYQKNNKNKYIIENDSPIIINELNILSKEINQFAHDNSIIELTQNDTSTSYESINIQEILNDKYHVMEIRRYSQNYKTVIYPIQKNNQIKDYCISNIDLSFKIKKSKVYKYVDISEVNSPFYNGKQIIGYELPGRAKNKVKKNDIILSRLRGNISFSIVMDDNLIVTNGMCVLRPKDFDSLLVIFANLYESSFKIQHQSLTTGSIMECISDENINDIYLKTDCNVKKYKKIYDSMILLHNELSTI